MDRKSGNEERQRDFERRRNHREPMVWGSCQGSMPGMQPASKEKAGPVLEREQGRGRYCLELLALRAQRRGVL